jgi:cytosine/adenosine deaminase-related metal-dependent hydrolase
LTRYRAAWLLPISGPPLRDAWVDVMDGRVSAVGSGEHVHAATPSPEVGPTFRSGDRDLGDVAILPGLVNAHMHLELSYLRDAVAPAPTFIEWIRQVVGLRRTQPEPRSRTILDGIERGIAEAHRTGTVLAGDISNTLVTVDALSGGPLSAVVFYELLRFTCPDPDAFVKEALTRIGELTPADGVRVGLAAHAPYSVSPALFSAIRRAADLNPLVPYSVHLSESREEVQFIDRGDGPWRTFLEEMGVWDPEWRPAGQSPAQYLTDHQFLSDRTVVVHGVQMSAADLRLLADAGATLVTCPRSNQRTGAGRPPIAAFYASGVRVAVGTDSLASTPDLNLFAELAAVRALAPSVSARAILDSATRQGALALGFGDDYGTIEIGKRAPLLAVSLPPGTDDVEEYLLSGVTAERITWIG